MRLYSTLDRRVVDIKPIKENTISMYSCGPTVYYDMHIGNIRAYINWDVFHRALKYLGYDVHKVMNFTDVGHMSSKDDFGSDFGDDKVDRESKKEGIEPIDIANKYINSVLNDFKLLNILAPNGEDIPESLDYRDVEEYGFMRATNYIDEMISFIKKIEANGYTYETKQAVYFDVTKIPDYTIFTGQKLDEKSIGAREEVGIDPQKRNPADFVLWMKRYGKYADHAMHWSSPWGDGFPGWHIECSAMGTKALGEYFDIHTGGIDHIPVHHTNERAQNIGAFGHDAVRYWVHNEWLVNSDDSKLSKSKGNASTLAEAIAQGYDPMDIRYLFMSINYHTRIQFSSDSIQGARNARISLLNRLRELDNGKEGNILNEYVDRFKEDLNDNLNMSKLISDINELLKSDNSPEDIVYTIYDIDRVLGLRLKENVNREESIPEDIQSILNERAKARENRDYTKSDELRDILLSKGYTVLDTSDGQRITHE